MAIKLAFSTVACPEWGVRKVIEQAKAMGYQGVELRTLGAGGSGLASDPALSDAEKVGDEFREAGIEPVCLSTSISLHYAGTTAAREAHWAALAALEMAAKMGCGAVRFFGSAVELGQDRRAVIQRIAERARPLADRGGEMGVRILFENAGTFALAKEWWWLLDILDHPMVGLSWNPANAAAAGEPAGVSVPMLHSRIRLAKVKDTRVGEGSGFVPLGEGTVGIEGFIKRLLGIGYDGYLSVEWDRLWFGSLAPAEEYLPDAQKRVRGWLDAVAAAIEDAKPKPKVVKTEAKAAGAH